MSGSKPRGRKKYFEDYERSNAGEFIYKKQYYCFELNAKYRFTYVFFVLFSAAVFIFNGFLNNNGSRIFYIVLPYAATLLPLMFMLADVYKILKSDGKMTRKQHDKSFIQLKHMTIAAIFCSASAFTGTAVYLFYNFSLNDLLFMICSCAAIIAGYIFLKFQYKVINNIINV